MTQKTERENAIVREIHNEFDTASIRALKEAKEIIDGLSIHSKSEVLHKLGFHKAKGVSSYLQEKSKSDGAKKMFEIISEYALKYPQYKFITDDQSVHICTKYHLVCAPVSCYTGDVPAKNMIEMSEFIAKFNHFTIGYKINSMAFPYPSTDKFKIPVIKEYVKERGGFLTISELAEIETISDRLHGNIFSSACRMDTTTITTKENLSICAPSKDMDTIGLHQTGGFFKQMFSTKIVEIPDPVVLCKVPDGYLIITKWGIEEEDELLINEKMN